MRILTLMEDQLEGSMLCAEHGLSFYIETKKHKILMDTGTSEKTWENAKILGVDLSAIDTVIISHGHYDHAGGLMSFHEINPNPAIYMHKRAAGQFYHKERYIGIDSQILKLPKLKLLDQNLVIDDELSLFTNIEGRRLWPDSNRRLSELVEGQAIQDSFGHEQVLVVKENGRYYVFSGCAHNGILNILDRFQEIYHCEPDVVISGFHMVKKGDYSQEEEENIRQTAMELKKMKTKFYTGHCTGGPAFSIMKEIMEDQLCGIFVSIDTHF